MYVKSIKSRKSSYGDSFNKSVKCFTNKPKPETAIIEIDKYKEQTADVYQSYFQKQHCRIRNNTKQQNTTENNKRSHRKSTADRSELDRLKEETQQLEKNPSALKNQ